MRSGPVGHEISQLLMSSQCAREDCDLCPEDELDFGCSHICHGPDDSEDAMSEAGAGLQYPDSEDDETQADLDRFLSEDCPECRTPGAQRHLSAVGGCGTCAAGDPRPVNVPLRNEGIRLRP